MTTEQPTRPARPPRPGPAFRRAALGLPPAGPSTGAPAAARGGPPPRESLRDALARIPDLNRDLEAAAAVAASAAVAAGGGGAAERAAGAGAGAGAGNGTDANGDGDGDGRRIRTMASRLLNGPVPPDAEIAPVDGQAAPDVASVAAAAAVLDRGDPADAELFVSNGAAVEDPTDGIAVAPALAPVGLDPDAPDWLVAAAREEHEATARRGRGRAPVPVWRRVLFGGAVLGLIVAIPVLGRIGYTLVTESTDGRFSSNVKSPTDPGYETEVVSTPTQLLLHKDADGRPVAATVLSLSGADGGGAVLFVPLEAEVRNPAFGVDRISRAYDVLEERPPDGRKQVSVQVASLLNVGIDSVVEVDDRGWAQLVGPVAPLTITNPDPIEVDGVEIPSGEIELTAEEVGPFLAASRPGETSFNALVRHELVWDAWLTAVAESGRDDVVPGETTSGIGLFARSLADGPVSYSVVPTTPDDDEPALLRVDFTALNAMVLDAVPSPDPALPGSRPTVRLLNGVSAEEIPPGIIQTVVQIGGSVSVIGNGPTFDRDETTIVYANPDNQGYAELLQVALGGGTVRLDPEAEDSVALTVILGRDVIDAAPTPTTTDTESGGS